MPKFIGLLSVVFSGFVLTAASLRPQRAGPSSDQMLGFKNCMSAKRENFASVKAARMKADQGSKINLGFASGESFARAECKKINGIEPGDF